MIVSDDHACRCPECDADIADMIAECPSRPYTVNAQLPYGWMYTVTRPDGTPELACEAAYDGTDGGEPWSVHISVRACDYDTNQRGLHPHRCVCKSGQPCRTVSHEPMVITPPDDAEKRDLARRVINARMRMALIEHLAAEEHASWARWMEYLFTRCEAQPGGALVISAAYVDALRQQMATPYADLPEHEKQYDRDEVAHITPLIDRYTGAVKPAEKSSPVHA